MAATSVQAPPGYQRLVPLNREAHAGLGLPAPRYDWCAGLNAVHLNAAEFASAAASFPIAFARDDDTGDATPPATSL